MNSVLSCRQSTDESGRPSQAESGLEDEIKAELSEWENEEKALEKSKVHNIAWRSLSDSGLGNMGELHLGGCLDSHCGSAVGSSVNLGSCSISWS